MNMNLLVVTSIEGKRFLPGEGGGGATYKGNGKDKVGEGRSCLYSCVVVVGLFIAGC